MIKKNYRSEIDGLRALAVLPVVFYHAGFELFSGGYVGVDVFFVISGYLITSIILRELNDNTFSLKIFYERRARRILPALTFIIIVSSFFAFIFLTKSELVGFFQSVKATLLFYSNFYFWKSTPYFKTDSDFEPLLHTWSLSIEEQFYIVFPITLLFLYKFYKNKIFVFFVLVFFSSLFICQFLASKTGGTLNFYFTLSRAWELALGSICAYILTYKKLSFSETFKNFISIIGFILIFISVFYFDKKTLYPSINTLIPTIGTTLIILFASSETLIKKLLSTKILVGLGLISYSLYLLHQPLLAFGRIAFENFSNEKKYALLLLSVILALFSYEFIEKLFRHKNKINIYQFVKVCSASFILIILFSQININFFSKKNSTEITLAKLLVNKEAIYFVKMDERQFIKNRIIYETLSPNIIVVGSSRVRSIPKRGQELKLLNLSVSGASIEDQIAITEMALEKFNPQKIILSADPWLFNKKNYQIRWKSISKEYQRSLSNIKQMQKNDEILKDDNSIKDYNGYEKILDNFYNLLNVRKLDYDLDNKIKNLKRNVILRNGKIVYGSREIQKNIKPQLIDYSMDQFEFSKDKYDIYKQFIYYIKTIHKKDVILLLSPYHYTSYKLTIKKIPYYLKMEKKFEKLSEDLNIKIIGSYNSLKIKCEEKEFFDHMHPKESCMIKIINEIN
tara:strand:- start:461 stop:2500 length:2040 start_codon:yes stop_codon:yes gene_type:complete